MRAIGITAEARSPSLPAVPTVAEQGMPGFEFLTWFGFFARTGTPPEARARLEAATLHALAVPAVQEQLRQAAAQPIPREAAAFGEWYRQQVARWQGMVASGRLTRLD